MKTFNIQGQPIKGRVSNAGEVYLRAIASPVNSSQFRAIREQLRVISNSWAQFRAIARNGIAIGNPNQRASKFKMTVHEISSDPPFNLHDV